MPAQREDRSRDDFTTVTAVLDGVRDLLSERWAERPGAWCKTCANGCGSEGCCSPGVMADKDEHHADVAKFRDYFDYDEPIGRVPSHRALAVFRGRSLECAGRQAGARRNPTVPPQPASASSRCHWPRAAWHHAGLEPPRPRSR